MVLKSDQVESKDIGRLGHFDHPGGPFGHRRNEDPELEVMPVISHTRMLSHPPPGPAPYRHPGFWLRPGGLRRCYLTRKAPRISGWMRQKKV